MEARCRPRPARVGESGESAVVLMYRGGEEVLSTNRRNSLRSRTASDVAVVTLSFVAPVMAQVKIYFFRAVSASFSFCSLRCAALAAVHEDTACGRALLARALKLC